MQLPLHPLQLDVPRPASRSAVLPTPRRIYFGRRTLSVVLLILAWPSALAAAPADRIPDVQRQLDRTQRRGGVLASQVAGLVRRERVARARRLRAELERQRRTLARRLDATYRSDRPDAVTVLLEADGFADLLQDAAFLKRVLRQDGRVMLRTRRLRDRRFVRSLAPVG